MYYCKECGKIIDGDQKKCPFCGTEVNDITDREIFSDSTESFDKEKSIEEPIIESNPLDVTPTIREKYNPISNDFIKPEIQPLSNWIKVTLSVLIPTLPGLGSIIGIIASIIFMTKEDEDRKTLGYALLTYSVIFLILLCTCCMIFAFGFNTMQY